MNDKKAVFFDRDGTIIHDIGYPRDPALVHLMDGVQTALKILKQQGFLLILVSNQSGIGRGLITQEEARQVHLKVINLLADHGVTLDGVYYCPHAPDAMCNCRKPSPEMLFDAARRFRIDLSRSFMIGDKQRDIEAGKRAGCTTIFLQNSTDLTRSDCNADNLAKDWQEVIGYISESAINAV